MAGFKALQDACKVFEVELQRASTELFSAKISENFEDSISKKLRDLSLFTSKLGLLRAKTLALTHPSSELEHDEAVVLSDFGDTVTQKLVEQLLVKSATQAQAVRSLIQTPDNRLDPEMLERKQKILSAISEYQIQQSLLMQLDDTLKERESTLEQVREQWQREVEGVRALRGRGGGGVSADDPNYKKLSSRVESIEVMRWLVSRLALPARGGPYDWLRDPQRRLHAVKMARHPTDIHTFL